MEQPTLAKAWATQSDELRKRSDLAHKTNGTLTPCRTNARLLADLVEQAFRDAGYFPMMLLLGTIVRPVIDSGTQCNQCISDALLAVPGVAERLAPACKCGATLTSDGECENGCTQ